MIETSYVVKVIAHNGGDSKLLESSDHETELEALSYAFEYAHFIGKNKKGLNSFSVELHKRETEDAGVTISVKTVKVEVLP